MYRLQKPLTEDTVRELMKDRRYQDALHPEHRGFTDFVTSAFRALYSEPEKKFTRIGPRTAEPDTVIPDTQPTWMRERGLAAGSTSSDGGGPSSAMHAPTDQIAASLGRTGAPAESRPPDQEERPVYRPDPAVSGVSRL